MNRDDRGRGVVRGALMDGSTVILGIEIPSTNPVFLGIIAIHIPLGLACVIAGAIAMLSARDEDAIP